MIDLRERVVEILWPGLRERFRTSERPHLLEPCLRDEQAKADRILNIPEIREALNGRGVSAEGMGNVVVEGCTVVNSVDVGRLVPMNRKIIGGRDD